MLLALTLALAVPDFAPTLAQSAPLVYDDPAAPDVSVGLGLSFPEIALIYGSVFPTPELSIDGLFTLATVDAGATWHMPLSGRHALLVQGLVGWTHSVLQTRYFEYRGLRFFGGVGYGALASFDFRAVVGLSAEQVSPGGWGYVPTGFLMLGKTF